jgi:hypothetical protein
LNIPARVTDVTAVEHGDRIVVQFSVPRLTTEGVAMRDVPQLDLRAGPAPDPWDENVWAAQAKQIGGGPVENWRARYEIPVNGWTGRDIVIAVRAAGSNGRSAGWSNLVTVAVVPPPAKPEGLRAEAISEGVRLTWQGGGPLYRVWRRGPGEQAFASAGDVDRPEWMDRNTEYGKPYAYMAQTVVKTATGEAESQLSGEAQVTPADRFPPATPAGVAAIPANGSIDLMWERNTEPDFSAYRVYRAAPGGDFQPLTETGTTPSYSDRTVESGKVYRYAVSAVDSAGNESARSAAVEATAP